MIHGSLDKKERRESRRLKIKTEKLGEESSVQISMLSNEKKSRRWTVSGDEETLSKRTEEKPISTKVLGPSINRRKNVAKKSAPAFRPEGAQKPPRKARKGNSFLDFFSSPFKVNPKTLFAPSEEEKNREMSKIKIIAKRITADGKTAYLVKRNLKKCQDNIYLHAK